MLVLHLLNIQDYPLILNLTLLQFLLDSTKGYPSKYGLLKIDDEIITYTGIGTTSFTGCIRGFSGVDNMDQPLRPDLLSFNTTVGASHTGGTKVHNLSNSFYSCNF